ncbi:hypothetical protein FHS91_002755 [Sphingobium xanthum]|uniref:hypothetical protein n=1 Tax=Sphingobium xanthum TaxID=1387165 RepID=UPI0031BA9D19
MKNEPKTIVFTLETIGISGAGTMLRRPAERENIAIDGNDPPRSIGPRIAVQGGQSVGQLTGRELRLSRRRRQQRNGEERAQPHVIHA